MDIRISIVTMNFEGCWNAVSLMYDEHFYSFFKKKRGTQLEFHLSFFIFASE